MCKINLSMTRTGSKRKPIKGEFTSMYFDNYEMEINELCDYIKDGRTFSAVYNQPSYGIAGRKECNYEYSNIVAIDIDNSDCEMYDYIETLSLQPTVAYTTYSNGVDGKGFRFRFLYCFFDEIPSSCFSTLYNKVCVCNNITGEENDRHQSKISQLFIGNGSGNCNMIVNDECVYSVDDFLNEDEKCAKPITKDYNVYTFSNGNCAKNQNISFTDTSFTEAWKTMTDTEILTNYSHYYSTETTYIQDTDGELYTDLRDKEIYTQKRKWTYERYEENDRLIPYTQRLQYGEHRKKKIYLSLIRRRLIDNSITLENLAYCALYELYHYVNNTNKEHYITRYDLYRIACNACNTDIEKYRDTMKDKRKYKVNKMEAYKQGITPREVVCKINNEIKKENKKNRQKEIAKYFDPRKKDKKNLQILEEHGIKISRRTLTTFKKEYNKNKKNDYEEKN